MKPLSLLQIVFTYHFKQFKLKVTNALAKGLICVLPHTELSNGQ